ncbi:hypothetical protein FA95DRAFT_1494707 [Auriscalpium vulgare]|uniref:Uncharacterized protein n=1 Tax=Auriscalpium vulgare TaxID=40419 RepID=A0ACB8RQA7_9AGAM|nr:hypothetical protein FA95DRAFT_1494707 [Auriscalpium vulgare]
MDGYEFEPFEHLAPSYGDAQPPEEELKLDAGSGRAWVVKIPNYLVTRWRAVTTEGVHLATLRVYPTPTGTHTPPRIFVRVPPDPACSDDGPELFELALTDREVANELVVAESAREVVLAGTVKHEGQLVRRGGPSAGLSRRMRERREQAELPRAQVRMLGGPAGAMNRLRSGLAQPQGFGDLTTHGQKSTREHYTRIPRNQLLDMLFELFRERAHWPVKLLRERTRQPEAYVREILAEIAVLHRSGEFVGNWELKAMFTGNGAQVSAISGCNVGCLS